LDEIYSLPISIQAKLLRVIREGEIERIGGQRLIHLRFRLITATNSNLKGLSTDGSYQSDLYSEYPIKVGNRVGNDLKRQ
jgi:transcriptional regulator with GAF, ATPase, and Fis domain